MENRVVAFNDMELIGENVRYSESLGLPELQMAPCQHGGLFVLCGSGASLKDHIEDIRKDQEDGHPICAVKGAYDFLREHGITPNLYLSVEPRYRQVKNPGPETVYMLASRCHKKMYDDLKGYSICRWHSGTDKEAKLYKDKLAIGGGSTSGMRAINVAYVLGFKNFRLYGMDSCLRDGEKRAGQGKVDPSVYTYSLQVGDEEFIVNGGMGRQAEEFQMVYDIMPDIHIEVVGGGLLAKILEEREKEGKRT